MLLTAGVVLTGGLSAQKNGDINLSSACFDSLPYNTAHPCLAFSSWKSKADAGALYNRVNALLAADSLTPASRDWSDTGFAIVVPPQVPHGECAKPATGPDWISPSIAIRFQARRAKKDLRYVLFVQGSAVAVEGSTGGSMVLAMCYLALYHKAIEEAASSAVAGTQRAQPPIVAPAIRAGVWTYAARVEMGADRQDLGSRNVSISLTGGDTAAWLVVMNAEMEGQALLDSVIMRRADLRPVSRHAILGRTDLTLVVVDSVAHGLLRMDSTVVPLNVRLGPRSFLSYYALRAALTELPLQNGWTGQAGVLELGGEPAFAALTLRVEGEERVTVPAGEFDCWRLAVSGPGIDEHYWVSKVSREVIRTREPFGPPGAIMQLDLLSVVPRSE